MSFRTQEALPAFQTPPTLSHDVPDFDVVSEKHQTCKKKTLIKPKKQKFNSMIVASQKLDLAKRQPVSDGIDIFDPCQGEKEEKVDVPKPTCKNKRKAKQHKKQAKIAVPTPVVNQCKICGHQFDKPQQLGGHMSKAHPDKSSTYKNKILIRERREVERELLEKAKEVFLKLRPDLEKIDLKQDPLRSQIAQLKNKAKKAILGSQPQKQILEELPEDIEQMLQKILTAKKVNKS